MMKKELFGVRNNALKIYINKVTSKKLVTFWYSKIYLKHNKIEFLKITQIFSLNNGPSFMIKNLTKW